MSSGPRPHSSIRPGRKFSMTTSLRAISRRTGRAGLLAEVGGDRSLVAAEDVPPERRAVLMCRQVRSGSPPLGGSTLMTSAPNQASSAPQNGPARTWPSSRTRRPWSGRGGGADGVRASAATEDTPAPRSSRRVPATRRNYCATGCSMPNCRSSAFGLLRNSDRACATTDPGRSPRRPLRGRRGWRRAASRRRLRPFDRPWPCRCRSAPGRRRRHRCPGPSAPCASPG